MLRSSPPPWCDAGVVYTHVYIIIDIYIPTYIYMCILIYIYAAIFCSSAAHKGSGLHPYGHPH